LCSLVQSVEFYKNAKNDEFVPGLMHVKLDGYHVRDITFSAAFVDEFITKGRSKSRGIAS